MTILDEINAHKAKEVAERKELYPVKLLEKSIHFDSPVVSFKEYLLRPDKVGIIAEFKRKSPSKGIINAYAGVEETTIGYMQAGASALSVLTDANYFGGKTEDLSVARKYNFCPILRKDFVIDEYQIIEARSMGADVILLIAASMKPERLKELAKFAKSLSLNVLLEIHCEEELAHINEFVDVVGVNNRNLKEFKTDIANSKRLAPQIPDEFVKISESGLKDAETIMDLREHGFQGFLIGETFMKTARPHETCAAFIAQIQELMNVQA